MSVEAVTTMVDEKEHQFSRMWNEESKPKREKFRNRMKAQLDILHVTVTEENARAFYTGNLSVPLQERLYQSERPEPSFRQDRGRRRPMRR